MYLLTMEHHVHKDFTHAIIVKCVFLGSSGVGKTSLMERYINNIFDADTKSTMGVAFSLKHISMNNKTIKLDMWDTAGQERYNSIMPLYYRGASIIIVVFEIGNYSSFSRAKKWITEVRNYDNPDIKQMILLLGNKYDGNNTSANLLEYVNYANNNNLTFFECSAKTGQNVISSINYIVEKYIKETKISIVNKLDIEDLDLNLFKNKSRSCC